MFLASAMRLVSLEKRLEKLKTVNQYEGNNTISANT
jgi:hypothetical protein